ncbi:MAG TPA: AI-2E family transporter [Pyrinomonadaceae bacterium]|nr:AI-2E family transporter [Pyrinomonadaceae bacterium]
MTPRPDQPPVSEVAAWVQTRVVLRIIAILLAVAAFLWVVYKLTAVLLLVVLSIFFAYLVAPLVDLVEKPVHLGGRIVRIPRGVAIGVVYLFVFTVIAAGIYFLTPQFAAQFPEFKQQAGVYYKKISDTSARVNQYFTDHRMPPGMVKTVNDTFLGVIAKSGEVVSLAVEKMLGWIIFLPWIILIPILSFFFLKDADSFRRSALAMLPRGRLRWRGDELFQDINSTLAAYIRAQLTACVLIGIICSVGFALIGFPSPLVLGVIAGFCEFVPLVGPLVVATMVAMLALLQSGLGMAFVVLLFLGVLRVVHDYVVYPRIIGHGIHLHPLAVILAILAGAEIAGVVGIFLAIPGIAILTVAYRHWLEHRGSETIAEVLEEAVVEAEAESELSMTHPTTATTPEEMARVRPDLLTGELKIPKG